MNKVEIENGVLWVGDSAEVLKQYADNHFDSVITDAPYGIEFLGKDWDNNTGAIEVWQECLRVLKPGGYLLAFGAPRTYHRLATNLEDIGFEIKDSLMWLYSSGFPKTQDIGKRLSKKGINNDLDGWKTALKPAHEPIVMCRKPTKLSTMDNMMKYGVGALNIDATRIDIDASELESYQKVWKSGKAGGYSNGEGVYEEGHNSSDYTDSSIYMAEGRYPSHVIGEVSGYQKYFYHPKVSRKERHWGLNADAIDKISQNTMREHPLWEPSIGTDINRLKKKIIDSLEPKPFEGIYGNGKEHSVHTAGDKNTPITMKNVEQNVVNANTHPTIKPVALMLYLVKLITPPNGKVLDCFNGSGSTGMAVKEFGGEYVGIDLDENYIEISRKRILAWNNDGR